MAKQIMLCPLNGCKGTDKAIAAKKNYRFCPFCGSSLVYVCVDCGRPMTLLPDDRKTVRCIGCQNARSERHVAQYEQIKATVLGKLPAAAGGMKKLKKTIKTVKTIRKTATKLQTIQGRLPGKKVQANSNLKNAAEDKAI